MKLASIEYRRCGDWEKTEHYVVPDSMTSEQVEEAIQKAKTLYLMMAEKVEKESKLVSEVAPTSHVNQLQGDDLLLTGTELKKRYEEYWQQKNQLSQLKQVALGSFQAVLAQEGIISVAEYCDKEPTPKEVTNQTVNWGHRHGLNLKY